MTLDETVFAEYDVTCHTEGCDNAGFELRIWAAEDTPTIICGVCVQPIEDVVPA